MKPLTESQRKAARAKATIARSERADLKDRLRAGEISIDEVVNQHERKESISRLKVVDLLRCLPGVGEKRALAIMEDVGIATTRRLRGLGVNQKRALVNYLDQHSSLRRAQSIRKE